MPSAKLLRQLVKSGTEGNFDAFRTVTEQVIQEERAKQHHLLANDLERLLYGRLSPVNGVSRGIVDKVPEDKEMERMCKLIFFSLQTTSRSSSTSTTENHTW